MVESKERLLPVAIFAVSFFILVLEILLTRVFSVILFYHFAFMAISIALLGLGIAGMLIYIFPRFFSPEKSHKHITWSLTLFALSLLLVMIAFLKIHIPLEVTTVVAIKLALLYFVMVIPFLFGGIAIALIFTHFSKNISKLYFYDLMGASFGTLAAILVLKYMGGINGILLLAFLSILTAVGLSFSFRVRTRFSLSLAILIGMLLLTGIIFSPFELTYTKGAEESKVKGIKEFSAWNAISRVDLFDASDGKRIYIDADALTTAVKTEHSLDEAYQQVVRDINALPFYIKSNTKALIVGPGGGSDVVRALLFNNTIVGVEINDIIVNDIMKKRLLNFSGGLYLRDDVDIVVDEARSYIRRSKEKYGIIQMNSIDTFAATAAGAFTATENYLYTTEAFTDFLNHLEDDGIITITRWEFTRPQETIRLVAIAVDALEHAELDPEKNILIVKQKMPEIKRRSPIDSRANLMVKKTPFTQEEVILLRQKAEELGIEIVYDPYTREENAYHALVRAPNMKDFYENYPLEISPTTDDKPFFFYTLKLKDSIKIFSSASNTPLKTNLGLFLLVVTLIVTTALALLFLIGPLLIFRRKDLRGSTLNKSLILIYFAGIGFGFIVIEIVLMQKFILFLGHPVYALSVILFSLLLFSGIGSYTTKFIPIDKVKKQMVLNLIFMLLIIPCYLLLLPKVFTAAISQTLPLRIITSLLLLFPLGLVLGRFFPLGIKRIDAQYHEMIPWAWGVNGTTSVVGSVCALLLSIHLGFTIALIIGSYFYLLTLGVILRNMS